MNLDSPPPVVIALTGAIKTCKPKAEDALIRDAAYNAYELFMLFASVQPADSPELFEEMVWYALRYIRREERRTKKLTPLDSVQETLAAGDDEFSSLAEHDGLEKFLALLPKEIREIAEAHYLDGESYEILSKKYGVAADTLKHRVRRGIIELRKKLPPIELETWGRGRKPLKHKPKK